jgi:hypothetical protein
VSISETDDAVQRATRALLYRRGTYEMRKRHRMRQGADDQAKSLTRSIQSIDDLLDTAARICANYPHARSVFSELLVESRELLIDQGKVGDLETDSAHLAFMQFQGVVDLLDSATRHRDLLRDSKSPAEVRSLAVGEAASDSSLAPTTDPMAEVQCEEPRKGRFITSTQFLHEVGYVVTRIERLGEVGSAERVSYAMGDRYPEVASASDRVLKINAKPFGGWPEARKAARAHYRSCTSGPSCVPPEVPNLPV